MTDAVYCALLHYPVRDRAGATVTTAVTALDVHDLARSACVFGVRHYFVVTPIAAQQRLVERILGHWVSGAGRRRMPERSTALRRCSVAHSLEDVCAAIQDRDGCSPKVVATAARDVGLPTVSFRALRDELGDSDAPWLVLFGTGHGLTDDVLRRADRVLAAISGTAEGYNHLSVRAAAAIVFDRLLCHERLAH